MCRERSKKRGQAKISYPENRWLLEATPAIRRRPDFFGQTAPRLPSRQTNRRKAVKTEVSNNEGTDTSTGRPGKGRPKAQRRKLSIDNRRDRRNRGIFATTVLRDGLKGQTAPGLIAYRCWRNPGKKPPKTPRKPAKECVFARNYPACNGLLSKCSAADVNLPNGLPMATAAENAGLKAMLSDERGDTRDRWAGRKTAAD